MEIEEIAIPPITLRWSNWVPWSELVLDARSGEGADVPNRNPGVYEVKNVGTGEFLTIGKTTDLRMRVKQGLAKGKMPHPAGREIRAQEDLEKVVVRWAETERPSAAEEELYRRHRAWFGRLPKYVHHS